MCDRILLCESCAVAAVNCDMSHIDAEDMDSVQASLESVGLISPTGETWDGYGRCFACGWDDIDPTIFECV